MPMLDLTVEQVISLVKQLPIEGKYAVLHAINAEREAWWKETCNTGRAADARLECRAGTGLGQYE